MMIKRQNRDLMAINKPLEPCCIANKRSFSFSQYDIHAAPRQGCK